jgi:hypothetical protein
LVQIETTNDIEARNILQNSEWNGAVRGEVGIVLEMDRKDIPHFTKFLVDKGIELVSVQPTHSLENYFLSLTTTNQHVAAYKN